MRYKVTVFYNPELDCLFGSREVARAYFSELTRDNERVSMYEGEVLIDEFDYHLIYNE